MKRIREILLEPAGLTVFACQPEPDTKVMKKYITASGEGKDL